MTVIKMALLNKRASISKIKMNDPNMEQLRKVVQDLIQQNSLLDGNSRQFAFFKK